jgi:hypothetical protein
LLIAPTRSRMASHTSSPNSWRSKRSRSLLPPMSESSKATRTNEKVLRRDGGGHLKRAVRRGRKICVGCRGTCGTHEAGVSSSTPTRQRCSSATAPSGHGGVPLHLAQPWR